MKIIPVLLAFLDAAVLCRAETTITAIQDDQPLKTTESKATEIERHSVALLVSCNYEAPGDVATEARWRSALGGPNTHVIFAEPREFSITFSTTGPSKTQEVTVKEILIPVSHDRSPDYILVRANPRVRAFAKYRGHEALLALQECLTTR